jgi:hypothetical protein
MLYAAFQSRSDLTAQADCDLMSIGTGLPQDCPDNCRGVVAAAGAEQLTLVDAVFSGDLDLADLEIGLQYATAADTISILSWFGS